MKLISNPGWRLTVDVATIVSALGLVLTGSVWAIKLLYEQRHVLWLSIPLAILLFVAFTLVVYKLGNEYKNILKRAKDQHAITEVKEEGEKASPESASKVIPRKKFVKNIFEYLRYKANEWSLDAYLDSENLYIDIDGTKIDYSFQAIYNSDSKAVKIAYYVRSKLGYGEDLEDISQWPQLLPKGLCDTYPNWREATIASLDSVFESLPKSYKIAIQQSPSSLSITINFTSGRVKKGHSFYFDNQDLINRTTGKHLNVQSAERAKKGNTQQPKQL